MTDFQSHRRRTFFAGIFLAAVTLAVYWPARHFEFVSYDDGDYVYANPVVRNGLTLSGMQWALIDRQANNWHPLTWLSHMADCQLFGVNPGAHHMVNVAFHCANTVLLFLLLQTLTGAFWRSAFVAALFALHPLRVESVAWISERKDVLSGFFFLLMLLAYAIHAKQKKSTPTCGTKKINGAEIFSKLSLPFFLLGLLSKPMLVTAPFVMLLLDFWPLRRVASYKLKVEGSKISKTQPATGNFQLVTEKTPFFLLSLVFIFITFIAQQPGLPSQPVGIFPRVESVVVNYYGYIEKLFWPHNLSFLYPRPETISLPLLLEAATVLILISALAIFARRRCPAVAVGWLWFFIMLFPVSGVVALGRLSIADRYTYLPSIGFYLMLTWIVADTAKVLLPERPRKIIFPGAAAIILIACAIFSREQLACWRNTGTLMEHALKIDPTNAVAKTELSAWRLAQEHPEKKKQLRMP